MDIDSNQFERTVAHAIMDKGVSEKVAFTVASWARFNGEDREVRGELRIAILPFDDQRQSIEIRDERGVIDDIVPNDGCQPLLAKAA